MNESNFHRFAAWSAFGAAVAWIIGIVSISLYFALIPGQGGGEIFGPISDYSSIFSSLLMIPVLVALSRLVTPTAPRLGQAALIVGSLAWLIMAAGQILFVLRLVDLAFTYNTAALSGVAALATLFFHGQARRAGLLPHRMTAIAIVASIGAAIGALAMVLVGMESPLTWLGVLSYLLSPIWLIWFGRMLLADRLPDLFVAI